MKLITVGCAAAKKFLHLMAILTHGSMMLGWLRIPEDFPMIFLAVTYPMFQGGADMSDDMYTGEEH